MMAHSNVRMRETVDPYGEADIWLRASSGGRPISWKEAVQRSPGLAKFQEHTHIDNLVVKSGRSGLARLTGLANQSFVAKKFCHLTKLMRGLNMHRTTVCGN